LGQTRGRRISQPPLVETQLNFRYFTCVKS
jgi:hypothetical protein